jgi:thioredoxin reductase (NADPH)
MEHLYDVIIIGGGPAGYTAALYSARAGLDTLLLEKTAPGGQMTATDLIENFPGFDSGIDGVTLGEKMRLNAERFGAKTEVRTALSVSLMGRVKSVQTDREILNSRSVIIATGAEPRKLGVSGESELIGRGVSYCAACDGVLFKNKDIVIAGGGNSAAVDAVQLSRVCNSVTVVNIGHTMTCESAYTEVLNSIGSIRILNNTSITELLYDDFLTGVVVRDVYTGAVKAIPCDGLFISIGRAPSTEIFRGQVTLDDEGYIVSDETPGTHLPRVFAAGDVSAKPLRQIITAASDGAVAAYFAHKYLSQPTVEKAAMM